MCVRLVNNEIGLLSNSWTFVSHTNIFNERRLAHSTNAESYYTKPKWQQSARALCCHFGLVYLDVGISIPGLLRLRLRNAKRGVVGRGRRFVGPVHGAKDRRRTYTVRGVPGASGGCQS